ncbi:hypothetical protein HKD37_14G040764 [Glycine soja]
MNEFTIKENVGYKTDKFEQSRLTVYCPNGCDWYCRAHFSKRTKTWKIKILEGSHQCKKIAEQILPLIRKDPTISISMLIEEIKKSLHLHNHLQKNMDDKTKGNHTNNYPDKNHIFPISFAIVEVETISDWFFFLKNFKIHVTPQSGLCLISDRHEAIKSDYNRGDNGWGDNKQLMSITFNTLDKISCKSIRMLKCANKLSKWMMFNRHYNDLNSNNAKTANRLKLIPKQKWTQAFDKGRRWGHMITNLADTKGYTLFTNNGDRQRYRQEACYTFRKKGMEAHVMITSGQEFGELSHKSLTSIVEKCVTHHVESYDPQNKTFTD